MSVFVVFLIIIVPVFVKDGIYCAIGTHFPVAVAVAAEKSAVAVAAQCPRAGACTHL